MLPNDNELPTTTYEAKQLVYPLGLEVKRYMHAPTIASSTEASTRIWMHVPYAVHCVTRLEKMILDIEGEPHRKKVPAKVMWYSPIIPRLKRSV